ncbi:hypothetical protein ASC77_08090 [Nocardioides sp. Root1257]|uniref:TolB family protein n=1 Tax=unclassified Nocardioides TaxID=2615069 RepID=UPI0006F8A3B8|nr:MULTISPECIES: PD40 domain-containing protein [unclassified Nocardioides]KQW48687.1 hypothetical protein ASC77_08090 [Nocardioides sp. Root1257]KRC47862.1 hypothetical protein ASE24_08095 [Nocardioides sp. Root224]
MVRAGRLALVLGTSAAALVLVPLAGGAEAHRGTTSVALPDRLADYSHLTADVTDAPVGRAVALYQRGFGVELFDSPQAVLLAADDDVYRRLGAAESRGGPESQGDPGPMLLSPDGRQVVLGDHDTGSPDLAVVDLGSGDVATHGLPDARSVIPVAWSPDGSRVAYLSDDSPTNPYSGGLIVGDLVVLDLASGEASPVPGGEDVSAAAFSPDGAELAVQHASGSGGLAIVDLASGAVRRVDATGSLAGPDAWSPDGSLLALVGAPGLSFVDPDGTGVPLTLARPATDGILGWTGSREVAVLESPDADDATITAYALDGGSRPLTAIGDLGSYGIGRIQLASGLIADLQARPAGSPDHGPWPPAFRIGVALVLGLAIALVVVLVDRRRGATKA